MHMLLTQLFEKLGSFRAGALNGWLSARTKRL